MAKEAKKAAKTSSKKSWPRRIWRFVWKFTMWFFIVTISWVILYRWIDPPITFLHIAERWNADDKTPYHYDWVDAEDISLNMKLAVVASEDNNFMKHNGFDWSAIEKAKKYNATHKKKRGASTISMQVAKNVFLWPSRTWIRKGFEVYFTFLIELFWSKERIMEVYLNVIEMGPNKFGVGAAAKDYFKTTPAKLTKAQAALIAGCLPNPKKFNPGKPSAYLLKRQGAITRLMRLIGDSYFERYADGIPDKELEKEKEDLDKQDE
jgi:monofunctional biosynthetic peptidoglycan transglycosylase